MALCACHLVDVVFISFESHADVEGRHCVRACHLVGVVFILLESRADAEGRHRVRVTL